MVLFPHQEGCDKVISAVKDGKLSIERVKDAVRRILSLKANIHLFEPEYFKDLEITGNIKELSQKLAQKSITKIRDFDNIIPARLEKGTGLEQVLCIPLFLLNREVDHIATGCIDCHILMYNKHSLTPLFQQIILLDGLVDQTHPVFRNGKAHAFHIYQKLAFLDLHFLV